WFRWGNEPPRFIWRKRPARRAGIQDLAQRLPVRVHLFRDLRRVSGAAFARLRMNLLDWLVLVGTMVGIAAYGAWRTRHTDNLNTYLKGNHNTGWLTIGLSVMATQASTITYLSLPGQAYENGMAFIQNYFGLP